MPFPIDLKRDAPVLCEPFIEDFARNVGVVKFSAEAVVLGDQNFQIFHGLNRSCLIVIMGYLSKHRATRIHVDRLLGVGQ